MTSRDEQVTAWAMMARSGDRGALENFVRATQRDVWRFIAHLAGSEAADDLAQECYARALASLPGFAGRSPARTWLLSIARNTVIDQLRLAQRRPRVGSADWEGELDRAGGHRGFEGEVELSLLLATLSAERREALVLTQILGLSYAEAAEITGCPVGTVRSRVARARADLVTAEPSLREGRQNRRTG